MPDTTSSRRHPGESRDPALCQRVLHQKRDASFRWHDDKDGGVISADCLPLWSQIRQDLIEIKQGQSEGHGARQKRRGNPRASASNSENWMVGDTGLEPVTPAM